MIVMRTELLEYCIVLTTDEFNSIHLVSDKLDCDIEDAVIACYLRGLFALQREFKLKE